MVPKKFTAAIIGLGNIGLGYDLAHDNDYVQTHAKAYVQNRNFTLAFGVDPDAKKRKDFERFTHAKAYGSLNNALKEFSSVDVMSVCVAPEHRGQLWDEVARMHPRVLVLEKPLAKDVREAKRILAWARTNKISLVVNYIRRFEPSTYVLKAALKKKRLGRTVGVDLRYNGGFYNNASHYIDLLRLIFGEPSKARHVRSEKDGRDLQVDFVLEYPDFEVHGRSVKTKCPAGEITFWCEQGKFFYQRFGQTIDVFEVRPDPVFRKFEELALTNSISGRTAYAMGGVVDHVYELCEGKKNSLSDGNNALETLKLCESILSNR